MILDDFEISFSGRIQLSFFVVPSFRYKLILVATNIGHLLPEGRLGNKEHFKLIIIQEKVMTLVTKVPKDMCVYCRQEAFILYLLQVWSHEIQIFCGRGKQNCFLFSSYYKFVK